jgi:mRNA interferase RelE/StbE
MYDLLLTRDAGHFYERADPPLVKRLNHCFERLRQNPYEHPNIKRLKDPLSGSYRYRIGDWRVVYKVEEEKRQVTILLIAHRSQAYR